MRRAINIMGWIAVFCTMISLILTFISTYSFIYLEYFKGYFTFNCCMVITMLLWSIKIYSWKETSKNMVYSLGCLLIAAGTVFFMVYGKIN